MEKTYTIIAFYNRPYAFDKEGVHHEGVTRCVALLVSQGKENVDVQCLKVGKNAPDSAVGSRGSMVLCDQWGRFIRLG